MTMLNLPPIWLELEIFTVVSTALLIAGLAVGQLTGLHLWHDNHRHF